MVGVAQLVERRTVAPNVVGSNPISHPNPSRLKTIHFSILPCSLAPRIIAQPLHNSLRGPPADSIFLCALSRKFSLRIFWKTTTQPSTFEIETFVSTSPGQRVAPIFLGRTPWLDRESLKKLAGLVGHGWPGSLLLGAPSAIFFARREGKTVFDHFTTLEIAEPSFEQRQRHELRKEIGEERRCRGLSVEAGMLSFRSPKMAALQLGLNELSRLHSAALAEHANLL